MIAFVLGNGNSRNAISIDSLLALGPVYACNAVYRTHTVTALVATDKAIAEQIQHSGYSNRARFYTRRPLKNCGALPVPKEYFGYSSGPIATAVAAKDSYRRLYLLGFDMGPAADGKFNNVFADTEFYKHSGSSPTYTGNWVKQLSQIMKDFRSTQFIRVFGNTTADIPEFNALENYKKIDIFDFYAQINKSKDL